MDDLTKVLFLATLGGATIPLGACLAAFERVRPRWLEEELRHSVIAFGGGALLAAIALVLVPEGTKHLAAPLALLLFGMGGLAFYAADRWLQGSGGAAAQFLAMLLDYLPESLALGAMLAAGSPSGLLLALLIALQNLPEGFNAYREMLAASETRASRTLLAAFCALVLLGPAAALAGYTLFAPESPFLAGVMLFAAGGIFYLIFEDIAPQVPLRNHGAPALGAVGGFLLGLAGHLLLR